VICDVIIGATPARKVSAYWGGDNPWVKIGELDGGVIRDTAERISDEGVARSPSKLIPAGTLLFSFKLSIGKTAVTGVDLYTNEAIAALPVKDERVVMRDFLHYYLKSHSHIQGAEVAAKGALLNSHKVAQISVPLPSPSEQRRIVEILDQADAIRKKRAEADKLAARILPALFYDMFGDPATNPRGWEVKPLGNVITCLDRMRVPVKEEDRALRRGDVPYYGANGQVDWIDAALFDEPLLLVAEDGGHFDEPSKGVAYTIVGPSWVNNHAHVLRPNIDEVALDYLEWHFRHFNFMPFITGTTRAKLVQGDLVRVPTMVPRWSFSSYSARPPAK